MEPCERKGKTIHSEAPAVLGMSLMNVMKRLKMVKLRLMWWKICVSWIVQEFVNRLYKDLEGMRGSIDFNLWSPRKHIAWN